MIDHALAAELMIAFAERTGLTSTRPPRRYLWTDAFAVCNFLSLAHATGAGEYLELARRLVDQVHHVLGRHRGDDPRAGWLSGLDDRDGELHPTRGGLRIGKPLPERGIHEPFDEQLEWERDGQYFHYLTKWMHALDRIGLAAGEAKYGIWARELADAAHRGFVRSTESRRASMVWKASVDLSRPLVRAMGVHDALDGLITCAQLLANGPRQFDESMRRVDEAAADYAGMLGDPADWITLDPLGIGSLFVDGYRVHQLVGRAPRLRTDLCDDLLAAALTSFERYALHEPHRGPARHRLAFRELGLAIGLHALELMPGHRQGLVPFLRLRDDIESFWSAPQQRAAIAAADHRDIDEVMLATALAPAELLALGTS